MDKKFEPLEPLNIEFSKLKHQSVDACRCQGSEELKRLESCGCLLPYTPSISFDSTGDIPSIKIIVKEDEIKSAEDVINNIFSMFKSGSLTDCKQDHIKKELQLDVPKRELKSAADIQDAVISKIADVILSKMEGRLAIIKQKDSKLTCLNKDDKIEYLVYPGETDPAFDELPDDAKDGVIEDLIGVIEVTKQ